MTATIDKINVGERLRIDNGDIAGLAQSIREHGLLQPIVIDAKYNLVAGGRRLAAAKQVGMTEIEVKMLGELSEKELRVLELEENIRRKDLTEYEKSRNLAELADVIAEKLEEESDKCPESGHLNNPNKIGLRTVSKEIGVPKSAIHDAQQHVAAVNKYPDLIDFPKHRAINAARELDKMPDKSEQEAYTQKLKRESDKKVENDYKIHARVKKLIDSGFGQEVSEDDLDMYLRLEGKSLDESIERIDKTIKTFQTIREQLVSRKRIRRIK